MGYYCLGGVRFGLARDLEELDEDLLSDRNSSIAAAHDLLPLTVGRVNNTAILYAYLTLLVVPFRSLIAPMNEWNCSKNQVMIQQSEETLTTH
jgi:hypothetical protein